MPYCGKCFVRYPSNLANTCHTDRFRPDVQVSSSVKYMIDLRSVCRLLGDAHIIELEHIRGFEWTKNAHCGS